MGDVPRASGEGFRRRRSTFWPAFRPDAGLAALTALDAPSWLVDFYLWDATLGELHRRRGDRELALVHTKRALAAAPTNPEKALLERRIAKLLADTPVENKS